MKEIIEFYKKVVYTCNNSHCMNCPLNKINKSLYIQQCIYAILNHFIETDKVVGQKIYDEFVRLNIDKMPNLHFGIDRELYKEQLRILERYCKNNILEIE